MNVALQNLDILEEKSTVSCRFPANPFFIQLKLGTQKKCSKAPDFPTPQGGNSGLGPAQAEIKPRPGQPEGVKIQGGTRAVGMWDEHSSITSILPAWGYGGW